MDRYVTIRKRDSAESLPAISCLEDVLNPQDSQTRPCKNFASKHALSEVNGKVDHSHKQVVLDAMLRSFSEIGKFSQLHPTLHNDTGFIPLLNSPRRLDGHAISMSLTSRPHITGLDFDLKGVYLASVSSTGSLAIHDYESSYYRAQGYLRELVAPIMEISLCQKLEAVSWNPQNQDEVACIAAWGDKVYIYDISRVTDIPSQVLKVKSNAVKTIETTALLDFTFCKVHANRVIACGKLGEIYVWDRRVNNQSQTTFSCQQGGQLNCLALARDEQVVYAGSILGQFYAWDFRGGRNSAAFMVPNQAFNPPLGTWKITALLEKIPSLQAQTDIEISGIQSIHLNPCCDEQLAFHLNNGWSGVFDVRSLEVTHVHCPPPPWLYDDRDENIQMNTGIFLERKPTWLFGHSIYACPSLLASKVNLLDFHSGVTSPHHVENRNEALTTHFEIPTSELVVVCASHPLNDCILAGTVGASVLIIGHNNARNLLEGSD